MSQLGKNATASLFNEYKTVSIVVAAWTATTTSGADSEIVGGFIVGVYPTAWTAADKILNSVSAIATDGKITVTLGGNTTANQTFAVIVRLPSGNVA